MPCIMGTFYAKQLDSVKLLCVSHCPPSKCPLRRDFHPSAKSPHMALIWKGWHGLSPLPGERIRLWADWTLNGGPAKGRLYPTAGKGIFQVSFPETKKQVRPWVSLTLGIMGFLSWEQHLILSTYLHRKTEAWKGDGACPRPGSPFIVIQHCIYWATHCLYSFISLISKNTKAGFWRANNK